MVEKQLKLYDKTFELYISEKEIVGAIAKMAEDIRRDMAGKNPLFIGILNGAYMFAAELTSRLSPMCELTFAAFSSYRGTKSARIVQELLPIPKKNKERPYVLLEDIVDSGLTMQFVTNRLREDGVNDVRVATMLLKPKALQCDLKPDYVGLEVENDFIVGFGLDYEGLGRTSRNLYKLKVEN